MTMLQGPWQLVGWVVLGLLVVWTCSALVAVVIVWRARSRAIEHFDRIRSDVDHGLRSRPRR